MMKLSVELMLLWSESWSCYRILWWDRMGHWRWWSKWRGIEQLYIAMELIIDSRIPLRCRPCYDFILRHNFEVNAHVLASAFELRTWASNPWSCISPFLGSHESLPVLIKNNHSKHGRIMWGRELREGAQLKIQLWLWHVGIAYNTLSMTIM